MYHKKQNSMQPSKSIKRKKKRKNTYQRESQSNEFLQVPKGRGAISNPGFNALKGKKLLKIFI